MKEEFVMSRKFFSIGSAIYILALAMVTLPGCALIGLEEEETYTQTHGSLFYLQGTWVSGCYANGSYYKKSTVVFSGTDYTESTTDYPDSSCADSSKRYTLIHTQSNVIAREHTTLSDGSAGYFITSTWVKSTWTPQDSGLISAFNSANGGSGLCGINSWQLNQAMDVTGLDCGSSGNFASQGDANTYKYSVSGNSLKLDHFISITFTKQ